MSYIFLPAKVLFSLSSANSDSGLREWAGTPKHSRDTRCRKWVSGIASSRGMSVYRG